uniref:Uncharacterized protein n=1 Tax=Oryzias latipes TaxID=8090 RepID=A0A3P9IP87_ORYLA
GIWKHSVYSLKKCFSRPCFSLFKNTLFKIIPYRNRTECGHPISIVHCSSELLSSNHPPASASMKLGLQARATTPGGRSANKSAV